METVIETESYHQNIIDQLEQLSKATADEIKAQVLEGRFEIARRICADDFELPEIAEGWVLQFADRKKNGNTADILIMSDAIETKRFWYLGQIQRAMNAGLTRKQANAWVSTRAQGKAALIDQLVEVIKDENLTEAYTSYSTFFTSKEFGAWRKTYNVTDKLRRHERGTLSELVRAIVAVK